MKRKLTTLIVLSFAFILASCGMTTEEIDTAITQLDTIYQNGTYDEAKTEIEKLDKSYNKMSDEQKNKFGELRSSVEYAVASVQGINDSFNSVQNYYGQKLYYEAQQELDKILQNYKLPPSEQKKFDEKQTAVSQAITSWEITETIQQAEESFNNGNYNSASDMLSKIDTSNLTNEQNQKITSLKEKITSAKAKAERKKAEAERKKKENSMPEYVRELKNDLGVPDNINVTYKISEPYFWSGGGYNLISVDFYHNGEWVAGTEIDAITHEQVKGILMYNGK